MEIRDPGDVPGTPPPRGPYHRQPRAHWQQPTYTLPVSVPGDAVMIRTDEIAVWIGGVRAYPNGFDFVLRAVRGPNRPDAPESTDASLLRLEVAFGNGSSVVKHPGPPVPASVVRTGPDGITLLLLAGNGGPELWESRYWVHPLPPDGPVTLTGGWPEPGTPGGSVEFDGTAIRAAAAEAVRLWPDEEFDIPGGAAWSTSTG
ncbi:hypothetical protein [Streptomyces sp. IBSBF 2435]|uniref:hypothetical protein n=1 Tax=Streptomyces sp. IBSBF 2435 TaxID=2903531 RepID=UPI002FDBEA2D